MEPSQRKGEYTFHILLSFLIIKETGCVLILIAHDEEHLKHIEAHGFLIL